MTEWHIFRGMNFLLFYRLPQSILKIFSGKNLWLHLLAIGLTFILVVTGVDGWWRQHLHHSVLAGFLFPAVWVGFFIPVFLPLGLLLLGFILRHAQIRNIGWALGQSAILGWLVASFYKAFTGRPGPHFRGGDPSVDMSHVFRFGFWRGGIFWGWPSSHTAVACAMAFTLFFMFRRNKWVMLLAPLYGLFIGLGVSMTIHWFSDAVAGAIFGFVIGSVVGKAFTFSTAYTH